MCLRLGYTDILRVHWKTINNQSHHRSIICLDQPSASSIIDLLTPENSRHFARPRPITANYLQFPLKSYAAENLFALRIQLVFEECSHGMFLHQH
jgi:hypothetical protein